MELKTRRQPGRGKADRYNLCAGEGEERNVAAEGDEPAQPVHALKRRQALIRPVLAVPDVVRQNVATERMGDGYQWHRPACQRRVIQGADGFPDPGMNAPIGDGLFATTTLARRQLPVTGPVAQGVQQQRSKTPCIKICSLIGGLQVGILRRAQDVIPVDRLPS